MLVMLVMPLLIYRSSFSLCFSGFCFNADGDKIRCTFHVSQDVIDRRRARNLDTQATVPYEFTDIISLAIEILTDEKFVKDPKNYLFGFSPSERHNRQRRFGEVNSGTRYRDAMRLSGADRPAAPYRICPLLLWCDKVSPDFKRQSQLKPIAMTCGNLIGAI
jgi:hypothetical protein